MRPKNRFSSLFRILTPFRTHIVGTPGVYCSYQGYSFEVEKQLISFGYFNNLIWQTQRLVFHH